MGILTAEVKASLITGGLRASDVARKSPAGRKPWDEVVIFKALVLQALYNLSDDQVEYQLRDRLSFMRFIAGAPRVGTIDSRRSGRYSARLLIAEKCAARMRRSTMRRRAPIGMHFLKEVG